MNEKDFLKQLENVRRSIDAHPTTAEQCLHLEEPQAWCLYHLKEDYDYDDAFVLVLDIRGDNTCTVLPGSFDAMKGGPYDIVLPKKILGDYVILALDQKTELPFSALGTGFARLDVKTCRTILNTLKEFESGTQVDGPVYGYALPYFGKSDSRIFYHVQMANSMNLAKCTDAIKKPSIFTRLFAKVTTEDYALAAGGECRIQALYFKADGTNAVLEFRYDSKQLIVSVYDTEGEHSTALDGWSLFSEKGEFLGTIAGDCLNMEDILPVTDIEAVALLDPAGEPHGLTKEE